jgi:hypothetical protein
MVDVSTATTFAEGIFTTWTQLWDTSDTDYSNFVSGGGYGPTSDQHFIDEADSELIIWQGGAVVIQDLTTGKFLFAQAGFPGESTQINRPFGSVRSKYVALIGDTLGHGDRFSIVSGGKILFVSGSILIPGHSIINWRTLTISATGKYVSVEFEDLTTGLGHVQVWVGT